MNFLMLCTIFCKCNFFMEDRETLVWLYGTLVKSYLTQNFGPISLALAV